MKKKDKIALAIVGGVILLGAIGTYLYVRKINKDEEETDTDTDSGTKSDDPSGTTTVTQSTNTFPLKKGSRGSRVKELQKLLVCYGNLPKNQGEIDGIWGSNTQAAMEKHPIKMGVVRDENDYVQAIGRLSALTSSGCR